MGNAPGKTSSKSGSADDQSPFGLINEEAFARVIRYLSIKDYVNLSSLNTRIVKSFGSNNYYWAHVCQAATEPTAGGPSKIPLTLPKLIAKMYPGKKLTINGKGLHEYDYLNVSDKNVAKSFNFKEVIVKYFLRWVHFPKLETQCELYSKKTNALLIIQVADYTEKWDKYWTRKDPKTYKCATDFCYIVDFQVDPQRLEAMKATHPEIIGKNLPEEISGRIVLYARSNVQPREDKFKSPINMYESFMRKEAPQGPSNGEMSGGLDLVFSPRVVTPGGTSSPIPNQRNTLATSQPRQTNLQGSGRGNPTESNVLSMTTTGTPTKLGQNTTTNNAAPKYTMPQPTPNSNINNTTNTTPQPASPLTGQMNTGAPTEPAPNTTAAIPISPSTPSANTSATSSPSTASILMVDSLSKKDSLPQLRTTRNWSASRPNKSRSNSNVSLGTPPQDGNRVSIVMTDSRGIKREQEQNTVDSALEVPQQESQVPEQSIQTLQDIEMPDEEPQVDVQPPEMGVQDPEIDEPVIETPQISVQEPVTSQLNDSTEVVNVEVSANNAAVQPQAGGTLTVQPKSTPRFETTPRNPYETSPRPTPQHVDFDEPDLSLDSTVAPFLLAQQMNMANNNTSAQVTSPQPTPVPVQTPSMLQPPRPESPLQTGERPVTSEGEVRPVGRKTSVSELPLFKRYSSHTGEGVLPKQPPRYAAAKASANSSPQNSPKLGSRQPHLVEADEPQIKTDINDAQLSQPTVQITLPEEPSEPIVERQPSNEHSITLAGPSGEAMTLEEPSQDIIAPQPTVELTSSSDAQDQTEHGTLTPQQASLSVPSALLPKMQPRSASNSISARPVYQPPRPASNSFNARPLVQPPEPSITTTPVTNPTALSQPPKMPPKQPPTGPKQPTSRPLTQPPQPKVSVQTRPQPLPPQNQPPQQPPQTLPPQPKVTIQMRPQPQPPQLHPQQNIPQPVSQPPNAQLTPQPPQQPPQRPISRPVIEPPQAQPVPPPQQQEDDRFAEPMMETFRPVPPKPWRAIGAVKKTEDNM